MKLRPKLLYWISFLYAAFSIIILTLCVAAPQARKNLFMFWYGTTSAVWLILVIVMVRLFNSLLRLRKMNNVQEK